MCDNLQSNFDISDIPIVVYNLNPSIRSTLLNYKAFALHLNIDKFIKDPTSIKCCCNKYYNSFINNHYGHILTGNPNIVNNERLRQLISDGPKYREPKKICFEEARKEIKLVLINSLRKYQMTKYPQEPFFRMERSFYVISKSKNWYPSK